jgi:hypothetical protein
VSRPTHPAQSLAVLVPTAVVAVESLAAASLVEPAAVLSVGLLVLSPDLSCPVLSCPVLTCRLPGCAALHARVVMAFAFFGMNAVGVEIENPFGDDDNDLPIKKMMKRIELDTGALLEMRGISDQAVRQETEKKTAPFFKRAIEL